MADRPKLYLLHGDDDFSRDEELARVRRRAEEGPMGDLNTTLLSGDDLALEQLIQTCDTLPFMGERRLVIVRGLLGALPADARREPMPALLNYLERMPESTALMLIEDGFVKASHPVYRLVQERPWGFQKAFQRPRPGSQLNLWIQQRARGKGTQIEPGAAALLAAAVGNDLRLLEMEMEKLALHAGGGPIGEADVEAVVSGNFESDIFALVDALGERDGGRAHAQLHHLLLKGENALGVLSMMARQVRLLLQLKDLQTRGADDSVIQKNLGVHPFVLKKLHRQAPRFTLEQLLTAHRKVVETDWSIKRGRMEETTALDWLVAQLVGGRLELSA